MALFTIFVRREPIDELFRHLKADWITFLLVFLKLLRIYHSSISQNVSENGEQESPFEREKRITLLLSVLSRASKES